MDGMRIGRKPAAPAVHVVTEAGRNRREEIAARQRAYALKMGVRTLCLLAAIAAFAMHLPTILVLLPCIGAIVLPWMSVVSANAGPVRSPGQRLPKIDEQRRSLPRGED